MMPLNNNFAGLNSLVDQMTPPATPIRPIGLVWAWHALTKDAPLNAPALDPGHPAGHHPVADGLNTANRFSIDNPADVDARTTAGVRQHQKCRQRNADKIQIFTVLVIAGIRDPAGLRDARTAARRNIYFALSSSGEIGHRLQSDRHQPDEAAHRQITRRRLARQRKSPAEQPGLF